MNLKIYEEYINGSKGNFNMSLITLQAATNKYRSRSYGRTSSHSALAQLDVLRSLALDAPDMVPINPPAKASRPTKL